ncbi:hypothetical protein BGLA2_140014 [Burkholderia gladioli]|nr:hypothetical protein BGLA2_140014 [Burkholderia gladioli]
MVDQRNSTFVIDFCEVTAVTAVTSLKIIELCRYFGSFSGSNGSNSGRSYSDRGVPLLLSYSPVTPTRQP